MKPVIVSFPRSGRSWLGTMIGLVICKSQGRPIEEAVQARRDYVDMTHFKADKSLKVKAKDLPLPKLKDFKAPVVLITRDPRDVMVSAWLHATKNKGNFKGTLEEYIKDDRFGIDKWVAWHLNWFNSNVPFTHISYEELVQFTGETLDHVCDYLGVDFKPSIINEVAQLCTIEQCQEWEKTGFFKGGPKQPKGNDTESYYHRRGVAGGWRDYMSNSLASYINEKAEEVPWALITL